MKYRSDRPLFYCWIGITVLVFVDFIFTQHIGWLSAAFGWATATMERGRILRLTE